MQIFKVILYNLNCSLSPESILNFKNSFCLFSFIFLMSSFSASISEGQECPEYTMDVSLIEFFELDGSQTNAIENIVGLELFFSLHHLDSRTTFQAIGVGRAENFQTIFGSEFGRFTANATIADVVKETIRDGYRQLNGILEKAQELEEEQLFTCIVQGNDDESRRNILRLEPVPDIFISLSFRPNRTSNDYDGNRPIRRNIAPYISHYLVREASDFGFEVVQ